MDVWIQGLRPARLLLALGVIAWLAGMLRPDGSLAGASTMSFTILHLAPLGIAVAGAGVVLTSLGALRWGAVVAMGAGVAAMLWGDLDHSISLLHLGVAAGVAVLAVTTHGAERALGTIGAGAAVVLAAATWPESPIAPIDGLLVTALGMLIAAPLLALAFDDASSATVAERVERTVRRASAGSATIVGA